MTWQEQDLLESVVSSASELPPGERAAYLDAACADDASLRAEADSLLAALDDAERFFERLAAEALPVPLGDVASDVADVDPRVGTRVGSYDVQERLGSGSMGVVYRARDTRLDRTVALKFLATLGDAEAASRLLVEAKAAAGLDHPNVCPVFEIGEDEAGRPFIAMPAYEGETLREKLTRGPLPPEEALDYARQIQAGLNAAHERGVLHRDIKPGNLIVTDSGVVKIVDFGLAKLADLTMTESGTTLGTVAYMSPEQLRAEAVDHRTDLWSLGVVLYEMLTGARPFRGESREVVAHGILSSEPEPVSERRAGVPPHVDAILAGLLTKDPAQRFGIDARPEVVRRSRAKPALAAAALGLVLLVVTARGRETPPPAAVPAMATSELDPGALAVAPFRVGGASEELAYLREGVVDLLYARLTGEGGLRAVDPGAALAAYRALGPPGRDATSDDGVRLAHALGAGFALVGTVVGTTERVTLSAVLLGADGQTEIGRADASGPHRDLASLVDDLATRVLTTRAGAPEFAIRGPLPAVQAYLTGLQALREGRSQDAVTAFDRALAEDSTLTAAAMGLYRAGDRLGDVVSDALQRGLRLLAARRSELSPREDAYLEAVATGRADFTDTYLETIEAAIALDPGRAELWSRLGQEWTRNGAAMGVADWPHRARTALERALRSDPSSVPVHQDLLLLRFATGDTVGLRDLRTAYLDLDRDGEFRGFYEWRAAVALGDEDALREIRARFAEFPRNSIAWMVYYSMLDGVPMDDAEAALAALEARAATPEEYRQTVLPRATLLFARGRIREGLDLVSLEDQAAQRLILRLDDYDDLKREVLVLTEARAAAGGEVAEMCYVPMIKGMLGDTVGLRAAAERMSSVDHWMSPGRGAGLCHALIEGLVELHDPASAGLALHRADSILTRGNRGAPPSVLTSGILTNAFQMRGDLPRALRTIRKRIYLHNKGVFFQFPQALNAEGHLAAAVGDTAGAIRALRHYLRLRTDPDPELQPEVDRAREALARLERTGGGGP